MTIVRTADARQRSHGLWRALVGLCICCSAAALTGPSVATGARAPTVDLICLISGEFDFSPPLSFNTSTVTARGLASSCVSPSGRYARLKSAVVFATKPLVAKGCVPAPFSMTGPGSTMVWNDGSQSTIDVAVGTDPTGTLGFGLSVSAGTMKGATFTAAPLILTQHGLCLLGGVRSMTLGFGVITATNADAPSRVRSKPHRGGSRGRR